jgi:hypothetical protein
MIQLIDTGSLQRVAILEAPDRVMLRSLKFGSDGTKLAAATEGNFIHIWDLRRLRERLREMSLDWEAPPFHPGKSPSPKPIQVNIVSRHEASQSRLDFAACLSSPSQLGRAGTLDVPHALQPTDANGGRASFLCCAIRLRAIQLMQSAAKRWPLFNGSHRLTDVIARLQFKDGLHPKEAAA